jgi:hypothetical protein
MRRCIRAVPWMRYDGFGPRKYVPAFFNHVCCSFRHNLHKSIAVRKRYQKDAHMTQSRIHTGFARGLTART